MAKDVIEQYKNEAPYGWIVSPNQKDKHSLAVMINRLTGYGVEVNKAEEAFEHNGINYPKGTYLFPVSQPFGLYLKNLFEKQNYPDLRKYGHLWQGISGAKKFDGPPLAPYDGCGWTLPTQMGLEFNEMSSPLTVSQSLIKEVELEDGTIEGGGKYYIFPYSDNGSFIAANQILKEGGKIGRALKDISVKGKKYTKGTFVLEANSINKNTLKNIAKETNISFVGTSNNVKTKKLKKNKIALYKPWTASMDAGWISLILERYDFPFHFLTDAEVRTGNLNDNYDIIILPDQRSSSIINGNSAGSIHPDYVGGITIKGVENIKEFVKQGGELICNENSCQFAISEFKLPVKNVLANVKSDKFNCPGSIVKINYDNNNPLAFGLSNNGTGYFSRSMAFEIIQDSVKTKKKTKEAKTEKSIVKVKIEKAKKTKKANIIASYPDESLLVSGWMLGDELIRRKSAVLDVPYEKGNVLLYGFNFHNRVQSYSTFKLLFNALLY